MTRAVVVFGDRTEIWWVRILRRGFRHCFALVEVEGGWVMVDPLSHRTEIGLLPPLEAAEIVRFYRAHGHVAVIAPVRPAPWRMAPVRLYTCVEAVKRVLGLHAGAVLTPWQLYKFLRAEGKKALT